jgi:hypothetical protein
MVSSMSLLKKVLLSFAAVIAIIAVFWFPLALGLMAGFPFWMDEPDVKPVGARPTFKESAECLFQHRYYSAEQDLGVRLNSDEVALCFPPQTPAKKKALIACFNRYERDGPEHDWPEENMRVCGWDGLTAVPTPFAFGKVAASPVPPRAGKVFLLKVGVTGSNSAREEVDSAIATGALEVVVWVEDTPLDFALTFPADGKLHVKFKVPKTAAGKRLRITLTIAPDAPGSTKFVAFTVRR